MSKFNKILLEVLFIGFGLYGTLFFIMGVLYHVVDIIQKRGIQLTSWVYLNPFSVTDIYFALSIILLIISRRMYRRLKCYEY